MTAEKPLDQGRQETQSTYMYGVTSGIQTYVTLVGDECTHHYTISAPVDNFLIYIGDPKELDKRNMFCEM